MYIINISQKPFLLFLNSKFYKTDEKKKFTAGEYAPAVNKKFMILNLLPLCSHTEKVSDKDHKSGEPVEQTVKESVAAAGVAVIV